jgi:cyclohexanone monooxygenase
MVVRRALGGGYKQIEVTQEAQDAWVALLLTGMGSSAAGPSAYFKYLDAWRKSEAFEGLAFA